MRLNARSMVLLPQPEGPMMAVILLGIFQGDVFHRPEAPIIDAQVAHLDGVLPVAASFASATMAMVRERVRFQIHAILRE
jgi:hypothetical protein